VTRFLAAGNRDQRVSLQRRQAGQDALGQAVETWDTVAEIWAQAQPLRGRSWFAAGQVQSGVDVVFRIAMRAGVAPTWRVMWRGQAHEIVSVIEPDGAGQYLELMCATVVKDQA